MTISRRAILTALLGGVSVAATGCTPTPAPAGSTSAAGSSAPASTSSPSPSADTRPRWPLTGELLTDPQRARHAAVAVKVPDNKEEHPQRGIEKADLVFVELDGYRDPSGYSGTRLVPVFHSVLPESVGPVRSIRPVDVALLSPMHAIIGNTGAAPWVVEYARSQSATLEAMLSYMNTQGSGAYGIDRSRVRVLNGVTYYDRAVVCHPAVLAQQTTRFRDGPPGLYFPFASSAASTEHGTPATRITVPYKVPGTYDMSYAYDKASKRYRRSMPWGPHVSADGVRIAPVNVLIVMAHQHYGKIAPYHGHDEPLHDIIDAQGTFHYCHGGRAVTGTWHKRGLADPFTFTLSDGSPLVMAPGQTFVELPNDRATVTIA